MDSWGPGSDILWRPVAGFCHGVWTLLLVCKIRSSDDHKDLWFLAWCSMVLLVCKIRSSDDHEDLWFLAWFSMVLLVYKIRFSDDHKDLWCLAWFSMDFIDLR